MFVSFFRGLSGLLTAGIVVLTLVVVGAAVMGARQDFPGPGAQSIGWHIAAVVVAVIAQRTADRRGGVVSFVAALVVIAVTIGLLWSQWWG